MVQNKTRQLFFFFKQLASERANDRQFDPRVCNNKCTRPKTLPLHAARFIKS